MNSEQLKLLIGRDESETLEFKQRWYRFDEGTKGHQEGELVKDILSLANGSAYSTGETAYLVVGVGDKPSEDGKRPIFDVGDNIPTSTFILDKIRPKCEPPLESVQVEKHTLDGKTIFVVIIPFSRHLYETNKPINTEKRSYQEHTVIMRSGESIKIASAKEREALLKAKTRYFTETRNVNPIYFGAIVGAIIGAILLSNTSEKILEKPGSNWIGTVVGLISGGYLGGSFGYILRSSKVIIADWPKVKRFTGKLLSNTRNSKL